MKPDQMIHLQFAYVNVAKQAEQLLLIKRLCFFHVSILTNHRLKADVGSYFGHDSKKFITDMRFDPNILVNRQTHLVNDIRLSSLNDTYSRISSNWFKASNICTWYCSRMLALLLEPGLFPLSDREFDQYYSHRCANYVARFGIPQNVENIGKGKKKLRGQEEYEC